MTTMTTMIKYVKLPFRFPVAELQQEVGHLTSSWVKHYNTNDYDGSWVALPLRSLGGSMTNVMAGMEDGSYEDTPLMQACPILAAAIDSFKCEKKAVRLLNLAAGSVIKEHKDVELCFEQGEARIHIPIMTNEALDFRLDGERVQMREGECWYMNFNLPHSVANMGTTDRVHLVMDCMVNDWLQDLFTKGDWEIKHIVEAPPMYSDKEQAEMIRSLQALGTSTALAIAEEMLAKTNNV